NRAVQAEGRERGWEPVAGCHHDRLTVFVKTQRASRWILSLTGSGSEAKPPLRGRRAAKCGSGVEHGNRGYFPIPRHDRLFLDVTGAENRAEVLVGRADGQVVSLAEAVALVEITDKGIRFGA